MDCFAGHLRKILLFVLVFCFCFGARSRNSVAHLLPAPLELSGQGSLRGFCFFGCSVLCVCGFCFCCFVCFVLCFEPYLTSDCVMVRTPLLTFQCGTWYLHLLNSFISTTMCDDLARATEVQDGKKDLSTCCHPTSASQDLKLLLSGLRTTSFGDCYSRRHITSYKYFQFAPRLCRVDMTQPLEKIRVTVSRFFPNALFLYLPRIANCIADDLAGAFCSASTDKTPQFNRSAGAVLIKPNLPPHCFKQGFGR